MKNILILISMCLVTFSCKLKENSDLDRSLSVSSSELFEEESFGDYSLAAGMAYGVAVKPVGDFTVASTQILRIPKIENNPNASFCEIESDGYDVKFYMAEEYDLFEISGEDFSGQENFFVEIVNSGKTLGRLKCFNLPKTLKSGGVKLSELDLVLSSNFKLILKK